MSDIACPYCKYKQEVCHDDGEAYSEDEKHEMQCYECEKYFVFNTVISFDYYEHKADCLNGSEHKLKPTNTFPVMFMKMRCTDCDYQRPLNDSEKLEFNIIKAIEDE